MDEDLKTSLVRFMQKKAQLLDAELPGDATKPIIAGIDEQITKSLNRAIFGRPVVTAQNCTGFQCPGTFSCDWF